MSQGGGVTDGVVDTEGCAEALFIYTGLQRRHCCLNYCCYGVNFLDEQIFPLVAPVFCFQVFNESNYRIWIYIHINIKKQFEQGWYLIHWLCCIELKLIITKFKGTVSRDFSFPVFSSNNFSWSKKACPETNSNFFEYSWSYSYSLLTPRWCTGELIRINFFKHKSHVLK